MPVHRLCSSIVIAAIAATACTYPDAPVPVPSVPATNAHRSHPNGPPTIDQEFIELAQSSPGFAGMYLENGRMIVNVEARADRPTMARALREWARREDRTTWAAGIAKGLTFRTVPYSFDQLAEWRLKLVSGGRIPSLVNIDIDERLNRIQLGVSDVAAAAIPSRLATLGIPAAAVAVVRSGPLEFETTVRDYFRPVPGGVLVQGPYLNCSVAANVHSSNYGEGFITASHCTAAFGDYPDMSSFSQNMTPGNEIGVEGADGFIESCPVHVVPEGGNCRWSDASWIGYLNQLDSQRGYIARTIMPNETFLDMRSTISSEHPRFAVAGASLVRLPVGATVSKMGKTTGWTTGTIVATCKDYLRDSGIWLRCQSGANYDSEGGDSGGAIFTWDGSSSSITLQGVHGGREYPGAPERVFSPWLYVDWDLNWQIGSMTVTPP